MTNSEVDEKLAELVAQTNSLQDLFRRRLLEDRNNRAVIEELRLTIAQLEDERTGRQLVPFLEAASLLITRVRSESERRADSFLASVNEELVDSLRIFGIKVIDQPGPYDARRHEIIEMLPGDGSILVVRQILSPGFERSNYVLKPAKVLAIREIAGGEHES